MPPSISFRSAPAETSRSAPSTKKTPDPATPASGARVRPDGEQPLSRAAAFGAQQASKLRRAADHLRPKDGPKTYVTPQLLEQMHAQAEQPTGKFWPADYIPLLDNQKQKQRGSAIANPHTGELICARDAHGKVTAQSTTKVYQAIHLIMLMGAKGEDELFKTVGAQPSEEAFNADSRLPDEPHKPLNPFINIGALATTNRVYEKLTAEGKDPDAEFLKMMRHLTEDPTIETDTAVAESESETGGNNRKLLGNVDRERQALNATLPDGEKFPPIHIRESADTYFRQCATKMSAANHAKALWNLEHGTNPETGNKYLTPRQLEVVKTLVERSGNYNQSEILGQKTGAVPKAVDGTAAPKEASSTRKKLHLSFGKKATDGADGGVAATGDSAISQATEKGAIAKSGVGGTEMGWIRSQIAGQPDIPFASVTEGLNNFGNPKEGIKIMSSLAKLKLAFKEDNPMKRLKQKAEDLRPGAVYTPPTKASPREISKQLMNKMETLDQRELKRLVLAEQTPEAVAKITARSERGFYLKEAKPGEEVENGKELMRARDVDGNMRAYTLAVGHNVGPHGTTGGAKVVVSLAPEPLPEIDQSPLV
jgi:glutaminase